MKHPTPYTVRELKKAELPAIFPLIRQLNPTMTKAVFSKHLKDMLAGGYRAIAVFDGKKMVGLSGFWLRTRFWCGKQLDIDNVVVDAAYRSNGIGKLMDDWMMQFAKKHKVELIVLDSYATFYDAHRFYHRMGYGITGYHFTKVPATGKPFRKDA
jgi:GNAT superfamily N-acetyltransferase